MTSKREIQSWARQETLVADCGDKRLNQRLGLLLNTLGQAPGASIPQACQGRHSEIAAAYRFFDHEATTPANILAPHAQSSAPKNGNPHGR